jgi:signal transduction histidine kinase
MNATVNILLVDDERRNLDVLESILASPDLHLVCTTNPDDALLALVQAEFACIILDIQMPSMSGLELARLIKTRRRNQYIPILFLTAYFLEEKDILQGYGAGAVDYLTKPINPQILRSKVGVFVDLFRTTHALSAANSALESEIGQRKKAEEALRQNNNDLEARVQERTGELKRAHEEVLAASRAKDDFLAALSHELRTPLNPVLLIASDAAANRDLPPRIRADFDTIRKNIELEARLIDDLLDLTRIERGKILLDKQVLNVHQVLQDAVGQEREEMARKEISLTLKLEAQQALVNGDAVRLQQIFWNLLNNAVKFTPRGGRITVETAVDQINLSIRFSDTGIGMLPEEVARVFDAFSQGTHAEGENRVRFGGLGLGLAISEKLVEFHSGKIFARSEGRDKGTTFVVELPLAVGAEEPPSTANGQTPARAEPVPAKRNGIRILLVEDHEPTRTSLARLLVHRMYDVVTAGSVAEARRAANSGDFQLVISDIGLPDGNGYDLMMEFRKRHAVKGIALTGYGMEHDIIRSKNAGFALHLTKPVGIQSLETALSAVL